MKAPLAGLREGLQALRTQLNIARAVLDLAEVELTSTEPVEQLARVVHLQETVRDHGTEFRLHQYRSTIVALYGHLEKFLEQVTELAAARLATLATNYSDLPQAFRDQHFELTLEVLRRRGEPRFQGLVTEAELVARLHACHEGDPGFSVNAIVFTHHTANFRHDVAKAVLARASCDVRAIDDSRSLTAVMNDRFPGDERYTVINDLAQRRNEVSHGEVGDTLALAMMLDYIDVIEAYGVAITSAVVESLTKYAIDHVGITLGSPDKVFNNHIAGFESAKADLLVGDVVAYRRGDGRCALSKIQSLQVEGTDRDQTASGESVGMKTALRCTSGTTVFLMPAAVADLDGADLEVLTHADTP